MKVSPGFLLILGVLFWLDEGVGLLPWGLLACVLHELGHIVAAALFEGYVREISFTIVGAEMCLDYHKPLTYSQDSLVALAGPAINLLFGAIALAMGWQLAAALTLAVGVFNLLPVLPLDGGRVVYGLLAGRLDPDWAERLMTALSGCLVGALVGVGTVCAIHYANATLLLTALWLLAGVLRRGGEGS
ncbi:MAG: M50 family metallopeptidase [Oscillospiraceae bacterium]|nr:M50 family metallopeptidase [Oscillospiraceae bacterium]